MEHLRTDPGKLEFRPSAGQCPNIPFSTTKFEENEVRREDMRHDQTLVFEL
jgi:hypothetical protein